MFLQGRHGRLWLLAHQIERLKRKSIVVILSSFVALVAIIGALVGLGVDLPTLLGQNPLPLPERMPPGFNVIVAGFGFRQADGVIERNASADGVADLVYEVTINLQEVDNIRSWRDNGITHILSSNHEEREGVAAQLAEQFGADVVIYGIIESNGVVDRLTPEFYIADRFASLEPELIGSEYFGEPIEFIADSDDIAADTISSLEQRLFVLRLFLRGLSLYISGEYDGAYEVFNYLIEFENSLNDKNKQLSEEEKIIANAHIQLR